MNRKHTYLSTLLGALLMLEASALAQEESNAEPLELTRLREQFQARVDQEMIPWREKYKKELQKLEDRLVQERRLKEAVAVKAERDYGTGLSSKPTDGSSTAVATDAPNSASEARKILTGTVWLVYLAEDKKRESPVDVYQFVDSENAMVFTAKRNFAWSMSSASEGNIKFTNGDIDIKFDVQKSVASSSYQGKNYIMVLAGKPKSK